MSERPKDRKIALFSSFLILFLLSIQFSYCTVLYTRGSNYGLLAALAIPLDLPNRNIYVAYNFEANYGLPTNDSYNEWIDRWNLSENFVGIGNNVTSINGRMAKHSRYTRSSFYRSIVGYLELFQMNGTACLLRTICEVAESNLDEHNGLLGSIFKILFMPTTSEFENTIEQGENLYKAEQHGRSGKCVQYAKWCPTGLINLISAWT
ncbi:uncharacterized protein LOC119686993 [Teleopsis dalmanni]|uniref:uncharacterized protein LOC119686993 n=1 Tax=Teleopsis dalmanni TaxID=139649 RepID=UPI0018CCF0A8|nr:uncharacterized protein LOC119686993 [Teleopsis dalmanni]